MQCIFSYFHIDRINTFKCQKKKFWHQAFVLHLISPMKVESYWSVEHNTPKYWLEKCQFNIVSYGAHSVLDTRDFWAKYCDTRNCGVPYIVQNIVRPLTTLITHSMCSQRLRLAEGRQSKSIQLCGVNCRRTRFSLPLYTQSRPTKHRRKKTSSDKNVSKRATDKTSTYLKTDGIIMCSIWIID